MGVYMDESGIHDGSPVVTVAAYFAEPKIWRAWTLDRNRMKRPIRVFHAADCANLHTEFEGWDKAARDKLVAGLLPVIPKHHLPGICVGVHLHEFERAKLDIQNSRKCSGAPTRHAFNGLSSFC